ncbi:ATPase [Bacteroidia bacterium]|nr:ATPase [Bacteroidia bacterium]
MIQRKALDYLRKWKEAARRKPLVLRGARQVGKTTLVHEFSKEYDIFLKLNMEREQDRLVFEKYDDVNEIIREIFVINNQQIRNASTLLFIDEIQYSKRAIAMLRYFYEEANHIHVITAGSLLETIMDLRQISFPVGRVQYLAVRPCSFYEFLDGIGENFDLEVIQNRKVGVIHQRIIKHFRDYALVGGMPDAIVQFAESKDILSLTNIFVSLINSYKDDVEKYTKKDSLIKIIRAILDVGWTSAGSIINFEKFGNIPYRSREISEAFETIQKAMLLELIYPVSETRMPLMPNFRKQPKLVWLDTGIVNYSAGIYKEVFSVQDIQDVWRGRIAEHIVAQELLALSDNLLTRRVFWKRDKKGSEAEVDFVYSFDGMAIPIEVKSGHNSKLKSLHLFMEECPHNIAVRVWSQPFSIDKVQTPTGKEFDLVNLPFYYVGVLDSVLRDLNPTFTIEHTK